MKKDSLSRQPWSSLTGKGEEGMRKNWCSGRAGSGAWAEAGMGALPIQEREKLGRRIIEKAAGMEVKKPSRKEIDAWTARLLAENVEKTNHSC